MKKSLFPIILLLLSNTISAQQDVFAITGKDSPTIQFKDFRALDKNGNSGEVFFTADSEAKVYSQARKSIISEEKNSQTNSQAMTLAALAYDKKNDNLVYMPMFSSNIYVYNPKSKQTTLVEARLAKITPCDINTHITRMSTGFDGNIYAINNAGTQFIQISNQNNEYSAKDLGIIKDDKANGKNSFTAMETGFGGDMIADSDNNFYVFSTSGNVFKIITKDLNAVFIGKIQGLPENYTVNGAAGNAAGNVVIASAKGAALYEVSLENLVAKQLSGENNLHIYDLASKYILNERVTNSESFAKIDIYPTKIEDGYFNLKINDKSVNGNINLNVFDSSGKNVLKENIAVNNGNLLKEIALNNFVSGIYIINIANDKGKVLLTKKVLVTK